MWRTAAALLGLIGVAGPACAQARPHDKVVFACTTVTGMTARFLDQGDTAVFSYGRTGARPEIQVAISKAYARKDVQDMTPGRWYGAVSFRAKDAAYRAFVPYRDAGPEPYVEIVQAGKTVARADCTRAFTDNIVSADVFAGR